MDERRDLQTNAPDEGELLAAYLAAETDDVTTARIERRLLDEPHLADRLDALARTRQRLQRLDDVQPPVDLRARLDARLRAERVARAEAATHAEQPAGAHAAGRRGDRGTWSARWRLTPLATAAAVVLVAVIGAATLFTGGGSSVEESAESSNTAAEAPAAADGPVAEPFAAPDDEAAGGDTAARTDDAGGAQGAEQELSDPAEAGGAGQDSLPRVAVDAEIAARLRDDARATDRPAVREADLRRRSGLPTQPLCLTGSDAAAVDLVERDGQPVLTALVADGGDQRVVLFDPDDCIRLRAFTP